MSWTWKQKGKSGMDIDNYCVCKQRYMNEELDKSIKRIKELENSLSIALDINDKYQRENKELREKIDV